MKPVHRVMCQRALKSPNTDEAVGQKEKCVCGRAAVLCLKRTVMGQCVMRVRTGHPPAVSQLDREGLDVLNDTYQMRK